MTGQRALSIFKTSAKTTLATKISTVTTRVTFRVMQLWGTSNRPKAIKSRS